MPSLNESQAKQAASHAASQLIEDGMVVGLGTGSTTQKFIDELAIRCKQGLNIKAVATSEHVKNYALSKGISLIDLNTAGIIDIDVDGADEIDPQKRMIKGGGGALLREKIVASASREMVVVIDSSKLVDALGSHVLPIEIVQFGHEITILKLSTVGYIGKLRMLPSNRPFVTDNGNFIYDVKFQKPIDHPNVHHLTMIQIPGVVETGFFLEMAGRVFIGYPDGTVKLLP